MHLNPKGWYRLLLENARGNTREIAPVLLDGGSDEELIQQARRFASNHLAAMKIISPVGFRNGWDGHSQWLVYLVAEADLTKRNAVKDFPVWWMDHRKRVATGREAERLADMNPHANVKVMTLGDLLKGLGLL